MRGAKAGDGRRCTSAARLASRPSDEGGRPRSGRIHTRCKKGPNTAPATRATRDPARVALVLEPTPRNYRMFVAAPMACAKPDLVAAIAGRASRGSMRPVSKSGGTTGPTRSARSIM